MVLRSRHLPPFFALILACGTLLGCAQAAPEPPPETPLFTPVPLATHLGPPHSAMDDGPRAQAMGSSVTLAPGRFRYTISPGDTELGIAVRFRVCFLDIEQSNELNGRMTLRAGERIVVARTTSVDQALPQCRS